MKGIVITSENCASVCGRLEKFFNHDKFILWHCFKGGMRKRISDKIQHDSYGSTVLSSKSVTNSLEFTNHCYGFFASVRIDDVESFMVMPDCGHEIIFAGNRIIYKRPFTRRKKGDCYLYRCFQIAE